MLVGYFFYGRGSDIQKTLQGLLKKILHDILDSDHSLANHVLHGEEQGNVPIQQLTAKLESLKDWRWNELRLKNALKILFTQQTSPIKSLPLHRCA